jgi:hyperosmotically inducible protein
MKSKLSVVLLAIAGLVGCASNRAPDVTAQVRDSLKQAGLTNVTVSQNRDKGVVTLGGTVNQEQQKAQAAQIVQPLATGQVVANEIAVVPNGNNSAVKSVDSNLDKGIEANLDAALTQNNMHGIHHDTKNGVVTLTGDLPTAAARASAERIADGVPNVQQVVNEITVKNQSATSSTPRNPVR